MHVSSNARTIAFSLALAGIPPGIASAQTVVNAPVAPDTIYVARNGPRLGVSVVDLNGFGGGTGDPTYDPTYSTFTETSSKYVWNPNVRLQGNLLGLSMPTSTLNGGSAGVFTLARTSELGDLLVTAPTIASAGDMMLGQPLDLLYSNGPAPFGCQAGGGSLCALDALHRIDVAQGGAHTLQPSILGGTTLASAVGVGNAISFAPCPNPPPISGVPLCSSPLLRAIEPTSVFAASSSGLTNLLGPGDWHGIPALGVPPSGLLSLEQNGFFVGPSYPQPTLGACSDYVVRQQIGHFLYMIDRVHHEIVALNSNTFEVLARIPVPDPTELAMSPNVTMLAVTNRANDNVSFIDIDPRSATFHQVVQQTSVGHQPRGIVWDSGDEDVLVCNEGSNSVSIIASSSLAVRKTVGRGLDRPFAIAATPRQDGFGFARGVYYAWILDRAGHISLFESGPSGVGGLGFDDIVYRTPFAVDEPTAIQPDLLYLPGGVWIAHSNPLNTQGNPTGVSGGALLNLRITSGTAGIQYIQAGEPISVRGLGLSIWASIGPDQLTGKPLDLAFDDLRNLGALPNVPTAHSAHAVAPINGKGLIRRVNGTVVSTSTPNYMFVPVADPATGQGSGIDVIRLDAYVRIDVNYFHPGIQSIPARGVTGVASYFRQ